VPPPGGLGDYHSIVVPFENSTFILICLFHHSFDTVGLGRFVLVWGLDGFWRCHYTIHSTILFYILFIETTFIHSIHCIHSIHLFIVIHSLLLFYSIIPILSYSLIFIIIIIPFDDSFILFIPFIHCIPEHSFHSHHYIVPLFDDTVLVHSFILIVHSTICSFLIHSIPFITLIDDKFDDTDILNDFHSFDYWELPGNVHSVLFTFLLFIVVPFHSFPFSAFYTPHTLHTLVPHLPHHRWSVVPAFCSFVPILHWKFILHSILMHSGSF